MDDADEYDPNDEGGATEPIELDAALMWVATRDRRYLDCEAPPPSWQVETLRESMASSQRTSFVMARRAVELALLRALSEGKVEAWAGRGRWPSSWFASSEEPGRTTVEIKPASRTADHVVVVRTVEQRREALAVICDSLDLLEAFPDRAGQQERSERERPAAKARGPGRKSAAIREAADALWAAGPPTAMSVQERDQAIFERAFKKLGGSGPNRVTYRRALAGTKHEIPAKKTSGDMSQAVASERSKPSA